MEHRHRWFVLLKSEVRVFARLWVGLQSLGCFVTKELPLSERLGFETRLKRASRRARPQEVPRSDLTFASESVVAVPAPVCYTPTARIERESLVLEKRSLAPVQVLGQIARVSSVLAASALRVAPSALSVHQIAVFLLTESQETLANLVDLPSAQKL